MKSSICPKKQQSESLQELIISHPICARSSAIFGKRFFEEGIFFGIKNKANEKALGMYYDYENNEKGDYSTAVACEVNFSDGNNNDLSIIKIPAGKYAKFIVKGNGITAVSDFWKELWQMNLPRTFVCDFEEYQNSDMNNAEIHIYIGIK